MERPIKQIEKSLEDDLWVDGFHLDPKDGKKVFKRERKAVKKLMKLYDQEVDDDEDTDGGSISSEALASVQRAIDDLLKADLILAQVSLEEATDAPILDLERQDKVDKELARAQEELAKGDENRLAEKPDKAIDHYGKSWKHSTKAMKEKMCLPGGGHDRDDCRSARTGQGQAVRLPRNGVEAAESAEGLFTD